MSIPGADDMSTGQPVSYESGRIGVQPGQSNLVQEQRLNEFGPSSLSVGHAQMICYAYYSISCYTGAYLVTYLGRNWVVQMRPQLTASH